MLARRVRSLSGRLVEGAWNLRWFLLSGVLAITGLVGVRYEVPVWVAFSLGVVSLVMFVLEVRRYRRSQAEFEFGDRPYDSYKDVENAITGDARYELLRFQAGTFLVDRGVTSWIIDGGRAELAGESYRLPVELGEVARTYRRRRLRWRLDVFNGPVVGLDSNVARVDEGRSPLVLRPGTYFDHLGSDLFATVDATIQRRPAPWFGRSLYIDRHGRPRDFGDSWLLNAVGTSVVAITTDGAIVTVHQTHRNESSKNLLAPSGSGSLEPDDVVNSPTDSVVDVARTGAAREMADEAGVEPSEIAEVQFLGFGRWMDKGGKPELLLLARLSIDSHTARRRNPQRHDKPYSKYADPIRLAPVEQWVVGQPETMLVDEVAARLSLPLLVSLHLMGEAAVDPGSSARELLGRSVGV